MLSRWRGWPLPVLLAFVLSCSAFAQSLPLEGYYRPGNFVPVRIASLPQPPELSSQGAVTSIVAAHDTMVPFLPLTDAVHSVKVGGLSLPLRALKPDEKLVGYVLADPALAQRLFPDEKIIPIALEPANPLPAPIFAWDSLDAILLSSDACAKLRVDDIRTLLACGVVVAARSIRAPDAPFPWKQEGDLWTLRPNFKGPAGAAVDERLYQPLAGWTPARSTGERRLILICAAIFCLLTMMAYLLPRPWNWLAVLGLSTVAGTTTIVSTGSTGARSWILEGSMPHTAHDIPQHDRVIYFTSLDAGEFEFHPPTFPAYPLILSIPHLADLNLRLDGTVFRFHIAPGRPAGFLVRGLEEIPPLETGRPIHLEALRDLYR